VCGPFFNHKFLHQTLTILDHRIQPLAIALDLDLDATRIVPVGWMSLVNLTWSKFMSVCLLFPASGRKVQHAAFTTGTHLMQTIQLQNLTTLGDHPTLRPPNGLVPCDTSSAA
jgi:hypothetical protein